jgi:hypothetical protein
MWRRIQLQPALAPDGDCQRDCLLYHTMIHAEMTSKKLRPVHPGEVLREDFLTPMGLSPIALARAPHKTHTLPVSILLSPQRSQDRSPQPCTISIGARYSLQS